ncbi:phage tail tape measure protein [Cellulomonas sp. C5510]|uniref:phage tail tape measure protein n=1 Tax=Cellulomonas sp. C5510 TaxID=2871170 RepID=UPI001C9601C4|nr:phage tail tape measure protein [Cellulomonas sp. C5510]QZN86876.1 phage tail tape measure protein [Cellulomonas sp. C5510]
MSFTQVAAGGVRTIGVAIRGDASSLTRSLARSASEIQAWERTTSTSASRWSTAWKAATAIAVAGVLAMVAGLTAAGIAAAGFDQRMRNVNSLLHESAAGLSAMSGEVLELATELPTGANDLAEGLYDIASSGFDGAEGLTVLDASARAASAGLATTSDSVTAITAVLNAYGLSASSASDVSDVLFQTVNLGVLQFSDLTGVIGDVVGMASAARVPIDDVGSAIATMTLTGLSAAESGTSLNRVIQALIDPSDSLAGVYKTLGYESGLTALQTEGLYGVMEDLRKATGGSAEEYLKLFPEVRAARAAFALATDEGRTYARVQAEIGDETARLGATQATLDEQMKSTSAQWTVLTNTLQAGTIAIGMKVLPAVNDVLGAVQDLAEGAVPALEHGLQVVQPLLDSLYQGGVNVAEILGAIYDAASPVAGALAQMVGGATLAGLSVLSDSLGAITGFLADHPALVVAVAALWASRFLPSITSVVGGLQQFGKSLQYNVVWRLSEARAAWAAQALTMQNAARFTGGAHVATTRLGTALSVTAGAVRGAASAFMASGIATAALTAGIMAIVYAATDGANRLRETISNVTSGVDTLNEASVSQGIDELERLRDTLGAVQGFDTDWNWPWEEYDSNKQIEATNNALTELQIKTGNTTLNLIKLRDATGLSVDELRRLQEAQGIDLTMPIDDAKAQANRDKLISYIQDIEKQTGVSAAGMSEDWGMSIEDQEALADAIQATADKVRSAFSGATDVLGTWEPDIGVQEEKDALEKLADARERLSDVEKDAKSESRELKNAREGVADAEADLAEAQRKKAEGTLEAFYRNAIEMGTTFSTNLDTAMRMGLDPQVMARLLEEGPEQAGPIVQQMVDDNTGALIQMVNDAEAQLAEIQAKVVEQSRLTTMAINSDSDTMTRDLSSALDISSLSWGGATAEDIAAQLGLDVDEIRRIAEAFGITLAQGIQTGFDSAAPKLTVFSDGSFSTGPGAQRGMADGGIYPGYTPGRDIGYIGISGGEAVMRPEWTRAVGPSWVHRMNALARSGGVEAVRAAMGTYLGGFAGGGIPGYSQPNVITVPIEVTNERHTPWTIQRAYFTDRREAEGWGNRAKARAALAGRRVP